MPSLMKLDQPSLPSLFASNQTFYDFHITSSTMELTVPARFSFRSIFPCGPLDPRPTTHGGPSNASILHIFNPSPRSLPYIILYYYLPSAVLRRFHDLFLFSIPLPSFFPISICESLPWSLQAYFLCFWISSPSIRQFASSLSFCSTQSPTPYPREPTVTSSLSLH